MKTNEIVEKLIEAKKFYYEGNSIMSDSEFDTLEDMLKNIDPENTYFDIVGTNEIKGNKIKHSIPMLSMNKAKTVEDVQSWLEKILGKRVSLVIEPKIDGLSCSIKYVNGNLLYITTRGDGKIGQDITHIKDYINIPKQISSKENIEVRGELYLPKESIFPNPEEKPLRNLAVGLINRKENREDLKYINFVAYQIIGKNDLKTEVSKLKYLINEKFDVVKYKEIISIKELSNYYENYLETYRNDWSYETDGLIITVNENDLHEEIDSKYVVNHHHHYNIALKPPSESKKTTIKSIEWNLSRNGSLIPVIILEPVVIGVTKISRVTANNYENVKNLNLKKVDTLLIQRANDVIPFIEEVVKQSNEIFEVPVSCPSCFGDLELEGVHLKCKNKQCKEVILQKIIYWVKQSEMDQISDSTIRTLFEKGFIHSINDLYLIGEINTDILKEIEGMGDKKVTNLIEQIEKSKKMNIHRFITKLGIELVGEKALKKLKINSMIDFWKFNDTTYKIGQNIIAYKKENKDFIKELESILIIEDIKQSIVNSKGKVCMTGSGPKGRKDLIKDIEEKGYEFIDSINKETNILLCDDINGSSSKIKKAKSLGIKILTYNEFFK
jgi:DNA ligase (NAD+)